MRKTKKAILTGVLATLLMVGNTVLAEANVTMRLNGEPLDLPAIIRENRTLISVEDLNPFGIDHIHRHGDSVMIHNHIGDVVFPTDGGHVAFVLDQPRVLDVPAQYIEGVLYVPLRVLAEAIGVSIDFVDGVVVMEQDLSHLDILLAQLDHFRDYNIHGAIHRVAYGDSVAYIFGSMHIGQSRWFPLAHVVEEAMRRADVFVFEANFFTPELEEMIELGLTMERLEFLPDELTWADIAPPEVYAQFVENLATYSLMAGTDPERIRRLNPMILVNELNQLEVMPLIGLEGGFDSGVDAYVGNFALETGRPILGLRTISQELISIFDMSLEAMVEVMEGFTTLEETLEALIAEVEGEYDLAMYYATNQHAPIAQVFAQQFHLYEAIDSPLAIQMRDTLQWLRSYEFGREIARLLEEADTPTVFFVTVGLSHIIRGGLGIDGNGLTNVINTLEYLGFEPEGIY